jgi:hypothetical protein
MRSLVLLSVLAVTSGCGRSSDSTSNATAQSLDESGLPPECAEFKAAIDKIQGCEKLPRDLRARIQDGYDKTRADWMKLSAHSRSLLGKACTVGKDAYMTADVKKTCGW